MRTYQWANGSPFSGDIVPVVQALNKLNSKAAPDVVAAARSESSVLHPYIFHVGEKEAAKIHYEERARLLVRSIVWVTAEDDTPRRAYHFVAPEQEEDEERSPRIIISDDEMRKRPEYKAQIIHRLLSEIRRALADLQDLESEHVKPLKRLAKALEAELEEELEPEPA